MLSQFLCTAEGWGTPRISLSPFRGTRWGRGASSAGSSHSKGKWGTPDEVEASLDELLRKLEEALVDDEYVSVDTASAQYLSSQLETLEDGCLPATGAAHRRLVLLRSVLEVAKSIRSLRLEPSEAASPDAPIKMSIFSGLQILKLDGTPPELLEGLYDMRLQLKSLSIERTSLGSLVGLLAAQGTVSTEDLETGLGTGEIPREMWTELETLRVRYCMLPKTDPTLRLLSHVRRLELPHNSITSVEYFQDCMNLEHLDLSFNQLRNLAGINTVVGNIRTLLLRDNAIYSTEGLDRMFSLERLDLSNNELDELEEIGRLSSLPCLGSVNLRGNPVAATSRYRTNVLSLLGGRSIGKGAELSLVILDGKQASKTELRDVERLSFAAPEVLPGADRRGSKAVAKTCAVAEVEDDCANGLEGSASTPALLPSGACRRRHSGGVRKVATIGGDMGRRRRGRMSAAAAAGYDSDSSNAADESVETLEEDMEELVLMLRGGRSARKEGKGEKEDSKVAGLSQAKLATGAEAVPLAVAVASEDVRVVEALATEPAPTAEDLPAVYRGREEYARLQVSEHLQLYFREQVFTNDRPYLCAKRRSLTIPIGGESMLHLFRETVIPYLGGSSGMGESTCQAAASGVHAMVHTRTLKGEAAGLAAGEVSVALVVTEASVYVIDEEGLRAGGTFGDAPRPCMLSRLSLAGLARIVIGFEFQKLRLEFEPSPGSCPCSLHSLVVMTRSRSRSYTLLSLLESLANKARGARTPPVAIENEDAALLERIGRLPDQGHTAAVLSYSCLFQKWPLRPWVLAPRTLVVTTERVWLLDEDHGELWGLLNPTPQAQLAATAAASQGGAMMSTPPRARRGSRPSPVMSPIFTVGPADQEDKGGDGADKQHVAASFHCLDSSPVSDLVEVKVGIEQPAQFTVVFRSGGVMGGWRRKEWSLQSRTRGGAEKTVEQLRAVAGGAASGKVSPLARPASLVAS
ncbi:unnamed protein product [Chrysoparadoxa australica]